MPMGVLFWILVLLWLVLGAWVTYSLAVPLVGFNLLLFLLIFVLGWKVFGPPLQ